MLYGTREVPASGQTVETALFGTECCCCMERPSRKGCTASGFLENLGGEECRGHRRRPAGIEGEMGDQLADLVLADAIAERALQMAAQLLAAAHRHEGGDRDQA